MRKYITIRLEHSTESGQLYPTYIDDADILGISSRIPEDWPYGVNIDGSVVFDLNRDGLLKNIELIIGRRLWIVNPNLHSPVISSLYNVVLTRESIAHKSFFFPNTLVQTNQQRNCAFMLFDTSQKDGTWIGVSNQCYFLVKNEAFLGFYSYGFR